MPEEHKIFMEEYEKYGNNCTLIAKVLNTRTPAQIQKHAECLFVPPSVVPSVSKGQESRVKECKPY